MWDFWNRSDCRTVRLWAALLLVGVLAGMGFVLSGLLAESARLMGILWPDAEDAFLVEGDSMLPHFSGGAFCETCPTCGFRGLFPQEGAGVCPNCGWITSEKERWTEMFAKKVQRVQQFDTLRPVAGPWQRDDCVCFTGQDGETYLKRIAALPGEMLELRDGKRFINGQRPVRELEKLRQTGILVHDDRFPPNGISRWKQTAAAEWIYEHENGRLTAENSIVRCLLTPAPITNALSQNGTQMRSDQTFVMRELTLDVEIHYHAGDGLLQVELPSDEGTTRFSLTASQLRETADWTFTTRDGVPRVWRNDKPIACPCQTEKQASPPRIRLTGTLDVETADKILTRDEYILVRNNHLPPILCTGFFFLGDNTLVSRDSRFWGPVSLTPGEGAHKVIRE